MSTRKTLMERLAHRNHKELVSLPPHVHVVAEYDLLARRVRKQNTKNAPPTYRDALYDVLAMIKELKQ